MSRKQEEEQEQLKVTRLHGLRTLSRTAQPTDGRPGDRGGGEKDGTSTGSLCGDGRVWVDLKKKKTVLTDAGHLVFLPGESSLTRSTPSPSHPLPPSSPPTGFLRSSAEAFLSMNYARVNTLALDATLLLTTSSASR